MITLKDFIIDELKLYRIPVNKKNLAKLRNKFTKKLKEKNIWNTAKIETIGRNATKLFKTEDLQKIAQESDDYLTNLAIKQAGFTLKEINKLKQKCQQELNKDQEKWFEFLDTHSQEEIYNHLHTPVLSSKEKKNALNELMLTAIFNHFFSMSKEQKELFLKDYQSNLDDPELMYDNVQWLMAQERLKNPKKYYYTEK